MSSQAPVRAQNNRNRVTERVPNVFLIFSLKVVAFCGRYLFGLLLPFFRFDLIRFSICCWFGGGRSLKKKKTTTTISHYNKNHEKGPVQRRRRSFASSSSFFSVCCDCVEWEGLVPFFCVQQQKRRDSHQKKSDFLFLSSSFPVAMAMATVAVVVVGAVTFIF